VFGPLPLRARLGLLALLTLLTVGVALAPGRLSSPIRKLANYRADTRDPIYNYPLDPRAIRRAAAILPNSSHATYYIHTRPEPQLGHDLIGAGLLFFLPAVPVPSPRKARWVLSYEAPTLLPKGVHAARTYAIGHRIYLVRLRPA
jgi:hypothetical protein